ncbi:radical SAM protein [Clostridiales bacterium PH28_bin88]|nr:radical SAM protein [Clostridiales bacterium PH28_bin88]
MAEHQPSYVALGIDALRRRAEEAYGRLTGCNLCPHDCGVDRLGEGRGVCRAGAEALISDYGPHFGEEAPLVGYRGSGTIFFAYCNMKCVFCQNCEISWGGEGNVVPVEKLADIMLYLQRRGCHNVNLVTPTHFVPQILKALSLAAEEGLEIPLVYNCGGYESLSTLALLDGVVDIYMPDFKYHDTEIARRYSGIRDYVDKAKAAIREMYRQVGNLKTDERGIAYRGLLVRHLVLPERLAGTTEIMRFLAEEISPTTFVNVMRQYYPAYRAGEFPPLDRRVTAVEYREAVEEARKLGLNLLND